jgi:formate dehydrogenase subunit gamma
MMQGEIERYRRPTRFLHWFIAVSFGVLFLSGLILFLPTPISLLARDSWTRVFHRVFAAVFIIAPIVYLVTNRKVTAKGIAEAFKWGKEDIGWLKAAPRYYFLCDEKCMPPQGHMNTGQKLWWLMVIVFSVVFLATGTVMWFFKSVAPPTLLQVMVAVHDLAFVATAPMFFVHVYLSVFHTLMRPWNIGAWSSMARGKVSTEYARSHHAAWYAEAAGNADHSKSSTPGHDARVAWDTKK